MIKKLLFLLVLLLTATTGAWATPPNSIVINGTPQVGDKSISLTYYFNPANVPSITSFVPTLKVKCAADNKWDEMNLSLSDVSSGTTNISLNTLGEFEAGKTYEVCFAYYNGTWVDEVFQSFVPAGPATYAVTLAEGTEDATSWQGKAGEGDYQALPLEGVAANTAVSVKYNGSKKVKSVKAVKKAAAASVPDGAINGKFSVSASKQVYFSKGNLRYASGTWSFFDNQYDFYTGYSADAWDKFGWSTSATTYGMNTSTSSSTYSGDFVDWGNNSELKSALGTGWFTLSSDEWTYLFNERGASTVGGTANGRYAKAKVNNIQGVILFPDTYTHPDGVAAPTGVNATNNTGWNGNNYSSADWTKMESAGCVFLPAAGLRNGSSVLNKGTGGLYWSASPNGTDNAYCVNFGSVSLSTASSSRGYGLSVRLVQEVTE